MIPFASSLDFRRGRTASQARRQLQPPPSTCDATSGKEVVGVRPGGVYSQRGGAGGIREGIMEGICPGAWTACGLQGVPQGWEQFPMGCLAGLTARISLLL